MKPLADHTSPGSGAASPVRLAIDDGIAILTLDDPMSRNAIDASSGAALIDAIGRVVADARLRVLLLRAGGPMFSPGASIAFLAPDPPGTARHSPTPPRRARPRSVRIAIKVALCTLKANVGLKPFTPQRVLAALGKI